LNPALNAVDLPRGAMRDAGQAILIIIVCFVVEIRGCVLHSLRVARNTR
jgi:hypothetical protein